MITARIAKNLKKHTYIYSVMIVPYYFFRFLFYSFKEKSLWFYRYYPGHYGSTIPSAKSIEATRSKLFTSDYEMYDGIALNSSMQKELLCLMTPLFQEYAPTKTANSKKRYFYNNPVFGFNDGFILYAVMRLFKPRRIIEVGSGFSSALMMDTAEDFLPELNLTFIDPYSTNIITLIQDSKSKNHDVIRERVQDVNFSQFRELEKNDILFIDSSHVLKIGSDLSTIIFSILPSLAPGVLIHIHDIFYPFEYPEILIKEGRIWNEVYFVRAFLQHNNSFEILFFSSFVESQYREYIHDHMPGYSCGTGASLWLRKIL